MVSQLALSITYLIPSVVVYLWSNREVERRLGMCEGRTIYVFLLIIAAQQLTLLFFGALSSDFYDGINWIFANEPAAGFALQFVYMAIFVFCIHPIKSLLEFSYVAKSLAGGAGNEKVGKYLELQKETKAGMRAYIKLSWSVSVLFYFFVVIYHGSLN